MKKYKTFIIYLTTLSMAIYFLLLLSCSSETLDEKNYLESETVNISTTNTELVGGDEQVPEPETQVQQTTENNTPEDIVGEVIPPQVGCNLTFVIQGEGTVITDPPLDVIEPGDQVTLTAIPSSGWGFDRWGDYDYSTSKKIVAYNDQKVRAYFEKLVTISGYVVFNGRPIVEYTSELPEYFRAYDQARGNTITDNITFDPDTGAFTITDLLPSSNFGISFGFDVVPPFDGKPYRPGDYRGGIERLNLYDVEGLLELDLSAFRTVHLIQPIDNNNDQIRDPKPVYNSSNMKFSWEAIPEASVYEVFIQLYNESFEYLGTIWKEETSDFEVTVDLPANEENQYYSMYVWTYNPQGIRVGILGMTYTNGWGSDYRFRIE